MLAVEVSFYTKNKMKVDNRKKSSETKLEKFKKFKGAVSANYDIRFKRID